uniref:Nuclear receptor domain-containing protein n=1 Tax=Ditylenchus dipsaci TaxID=166011 RepID=A0A915EM43_9BILA
MHRDQNSPQADLLLTVCSICGDEADGQHFNAYACRACAAFFRRTVARNLSYTCRGDRQCIIDKVFRCMCRWCRLQKCYQVGMKKEAVQRHRTRMLATSSTQNLECLFEHGRDNQIQNNVGYSSTAPHEKEHSHSVPSLFTNSNEMLASEEDVTVSSYGSNAPFTMNYATTSDQCAMDNTPAPHPIGVSKSYGLGLQGMASKICSENEHKKALQRFLEISSMQQMFTNIVSSAPILNKIQLGYDRLQERRDELYGLVDVVNDANSKPKRTFVAGKLNLVQYMKDKDQEMNFIAEMMSAFHGFSHIPTGIKCRLCPSVQDTRLAFPEGIILDLIDNGFEVAGLSFMSDEEVNSARKPWYAQVIVEQLLPTLKVFEPTQIEICFCFSLLLFNVTDIHSEISVGTSSFCKSMVEAIYNEMNAYYNIHFKSKNILRRIIDMMSLISKTEVFRKYVCKEKKKYLLQKCSTCSKKIFT